jgi:hypothetical protein
VGTVDSVVLAAWLTFAGILINALISWHNKNKITEIRVMIDGQRTTMEATIAALRASVTSQQKQLHDAGAIVPPITGMPLPPSPPPTPSP